VSWFQSFRYLFKGQRDAASEQQQALAAKRDALQAALAHEQRQWELRKRKHEHSLSAIIDALNSVPYPCTRHGTARHGTTRHDTHMIRHPRSQAQCDLSAPSNLQKILCDTRASTAASWWCAEYSTSRATSSTRPSTCEARQRSPSPLATVRSLPTSELCVRCVRCVRY